MAHRLLYPAYFDVSLTRKEGRRVAKDKAVEHPDIFRLARAVSSLGLTSIQEDKKFPKRWYDAAGRLSVEYEGSKEELLKAVAEKL
ncbi:MAG TPA: signal recognition particle protein Srp19 [Methanocorpusculum sp.]|nr:signal recognition particle protein Srp19 [Methanocorpusculum sp.]